MMVRETISHKVSSVILLCENPNMVKFCKQRTMTTQIRAVKYTALHIQSEKSQWLSQRVHQLQKLGLLKT